MAKHAQRRQRRRRARVPLGLAVLLTANFLAVLATAHASVSEFAPAAEISATTQPGAGSDVTRGRTAALPGAKAPATVSRGVEREEISAPPYKTQPGHTFKLKPAVAQARWRARHPTEFQVSTFNLLGYGHTAKGGNRPGWASGTTRMHWAVDLLNGAGIDVAGFQEFQTEQYNVFQNIAGGAWDVYPGTALGRAAVQNSVVWREDTWSLVEAHTIGIPYFGGDIIQMPYVLLENTLTGERVWFGNFHNPADAHGAAQRWRNIAVGRESALAASLHADGTPVIMTGDFNDREQAFCPMTARAPMQAANGGSTGGGCNPPSHMEVDWIFGSTDFTFSGYVADSGQLVRKTTDHPFVYATATLD